MDDHTAKMYTDSITRYTKKYNISDKSKNIARQIMRESYFRYTLKNSIGASGPCQIMPMKEHDKLFKMTENYNSTVPVREQYFWIYTSVEVMCMLMSYYNIRYKSYTMALIAYWAGCNSEELKGYINNTYDFCSTDYYKYIMVDGYIEKNIMGM